MKKNLICVTIIGILFITSSCGFPPPTIIPPTTQQSTIVPTSGIPSEKTPTGFYWPTGTDKFGDYPAYLDDGCFGHIDYEDGYYHIGQDIMANVGDNVYAIADGENIHKSPNGWNFENNDENIGIVIHHVLENGDEFIAVYGHIHSNLREGQAVKAGDIIGTIGPYGTKSHLHFGIRSGISIDAPYGKMECKIAEL